MLSIVGANNHHMLASLDFKQLISWYFCMVVPPFKRSNIAILPSYARKTHFRFSQRLEQATTYLWIVHMYSVH